MVANVTTAKNSIRAVDMGEKLLFGTTGFVQRKRPGFSSFMHYFLLAVLVLLGATLLVYYESPEGCALSVAIGVCLGFISNTLEKLQKAKNALEFMNATFSSAIGKGYKFCCILKSSGEIVFYNRPFQVLFPAYLSQDKGTIDTLFLLYNIPQEHRDIIQSLMNSGSEGTVVTTLREEPNASGTPITLHVESIERPGGLFLLRGK